MKHERVRQVFYKLAADGIQVHIVLFTLPPGFQTTIAKQALLLQTTKTKLV